MLLVRKRRRLVVHIQPLLLAFAVAWAVGTFLVETAGVRLLICGMLAVLILAVALSMQRVVRRVSDDLEVWTAFGRRRLKVNQVFLGIVTHTSGRGGATVDVELRHGRTFEPGQASTMVSTHMALGLARAIHAGKRIADALDMLEPQLAPWLSAPSETSASAAAHGPRSFAWRRWWRLAGILALIASALLATTYGESGYAELFLRCSHPRQVRMAPIGTFTVPRSGSYRLEPTTTRVEVWDPGRGCWVRRDVALALDVRTVLNLDEISSSGTCAPEMTPPP